MIEVSSFDIATMVVARCFTQSMFSAGIIATTLWPITRPRVLWAASLVVQMIGFLLLVPALNGTGAVWMAISAATTSAGLSLQLLALQAFRKARTPVWVIAVPPALCVMILPLSRADFGTVITFVHLVEAIQFAWLAETVLPLSRPYARTGARSLLILGCTLALVTDIAVALDGLIDMLSSYGGAVMLMGTALAFILLNMGWLAAQKDFAELELERLAHTDGLTGLLNRRGFTERSVRALQRAARAKKPMTLLLIDLDHFKSINDRWGHEAGDRVLVALGDVIPASCRHDDLPVRLGGEEFAFLLFDTDVAGAHAVGERLKHLLAARHCLPDGGAVRFSGGVSAVSPEDRTVDAALARADAALYEAKAQGRDRIIEHGGHPALVGV